MTWVKTGGVSIADSLLKCAGAALGRVATGYTLQGFSSPAWPPASDRPVAAVVRSVAPCAPGVRGVAPRELLPSRGVSIADSLLKCAGAALGGSDRLHPPRVAVALVWRSSTSHTPKHSCFLFLLLLQHHEEDEEANTKWREFLRPI